MMNLQTNLYISQSQDPWVNLSLEEHLTKNVASGEIILFLWQNNHTVVIGRNQNAWKECRCEELERDGGRLARRLSGGGAVYHDLGNLNFSFIMQRRHYSLSRQLGVILQAVRAMGLNAEFSGRNDLLAEGRKFSGNSYYFNGEQALHHGTLLVAVDMAMLGLYLNVSAAKMNSKGIESVQSRVVNLAQLDPSISTEALSAAIRREFAREYGGAAVPLLLDQDSYEINALVQKNASWEWRFGKSPAFDVSWSRRFDWGEIELGLELNRGLIRSATVYSDALEEELIRQIQHRLPGCPYRSGDINRRIRDSSAQPEHQAIIADICTWLQENI